MPFCSSCGASLDEADRFCPSCGTPAFGPEQAAPDVEPEPVSEPVVEEPSAAYAFTPVAPEAVVEQANEPVEASSEEEPAKIPSVDPEEPSAEQAVTDQPIAEPAEKPEESPADPPEFDVFDDAEPLTPRHAAFHRPEPVPHHAPFVEPDFEPVAPSPGAFRPVPPSPVDAFVAPRPVVQPPAFGAISMGGYFWTLVLFCIPVIGQFVAAIWALGAARNPNRRNLAKAFLLLTLVFLVICAAAYLLMKLFPDQLLGWLPDGIERPFRTFLNLW